MIDEIFRKIEGFESYEISTYGNVKSFKSGVGKLLKQGIDSCGYKYVCLYNNGENKVISTHKLMAIVFLKHKPCGMKKVINHIDHNRQNNVLWNLEIITNRENTNLKHINHSSQFTGVHWSNGKNKWVAQIKIKGKNMYLGAYKKEYDAHVAYENKLATIKK